MSREIDLDKSALDPIELEWVQQRPWLFDEAAALGYQIDRQTGEITDTNPDRDTDTEEDFLDLNDLSFGELRALAKQNGLSAAGSREELMDRLVASQEG